jgi:hypothetical protein
MKSGQKLLAHNSNYSLFAQPLLLSLSDPSDITSADINPLHQAGVNIQGTLKDN